MENVYLYCVTRRGLSLSDGLQGVKQGRLELILWQELAAVSSVLAPEDLHFPMDDVLRHKEVIDYVHASLPVIPMRFPTILIGREKVRLFLQRHSSRLEEVLNRLEGKVEVSLIAMVNGRGDKPTHIEKHGIRPETRDGIGYLRQKKQIQEEMHKLSPGEEKVCKLLTERLNPLVTESQIERNSTFFSIHYLVGKDRLNEFEGQFEGIKGELPDKILYSGPWPPYSFVPEFLEV